MKRIALFLLLALGLSGISCEDDNDNPLLEEYTLAVPITMSEEDFRNSVDIIAPIPIDESGKIYTYKNYIFVNDQYQGIHIIDNSNPLSPQKIAFLKIPGNVDIAVKDDILYADSITDLLVFDITDIGNITMINRLANVLYGYVPWPFDADAIDYESFGQNGERHIGWEMRTLRMTPEEFQDRYGFTDDVAILEAAFSDASSGQGGSLARFNISGDFLYAVDSHNINVFDISDLDDPRDLQDVYAGFDIETIFNREQYLFLGSMRGMYIYDISSPASPEYVSEFQHGTACDPVVVDENYAYVTLRGGNGCGALESGLFIVDITDIYNPILVADYPMDEPYGLGIKNEKIFVCDGSSGLKVYDKTDIENLVQLDHFEDIVTFDVIPLEYTLLMIGEDVLYQYEYEEAGIELISQLELD